jgi:hypothetical protein
LLSKFDQRNQFPLRLTFYRSAGARQGRTHYRAPILNRSAARPLPLAMQEGNNHAFYRSLSKKMVMRDHLSAAAVLSVVGVLSSFPASPAQARCNLMHDLRSTNPSDPTSADPAKPTIDFNSNKPVDAATKDEILNNIMETGIPCQETVTGDGPEGAKKTQLQHRQRGFDFYSWLTFLALNSPADGRTRIDKSMPNTKAMWEDRKNFKQLLDVMLPYGAASNWTDPKKAPPGCESEFKPDTDMGIEIIEESYNQPFKTGALIDQQGNYALFDILMNKDMFDYIQEHKLYSRAGQQSAANSKLKVDFPAGKNPASGQAGQPGGIIIKVSWKILDSEAEKRRFHTVDAVISMLPDHGSTQRRCVRKTLGLVGFHVMHKTVTRLQWIWTSFEHVDNVPEQSEIRKQKAWNFYKVCNTRACPPVNETPPRPWEPKPALGLKFDDTFRSQIVRTTPLTEETKKMNRKFQEIVRGSVWENYMLLSTQWPSDFRCAQKTTHEPPAQPLPDTDLEKEPDMNCAPAPTFLANSTLETYSQGKVPLASSSCMACHGNATSYQLSPREADQFEPDGKLKAKFFNQTDFTFMLEKARGESQK